jgi:predicted hydrocarbon binding protein
MTIAQKALRSELGNFMSTVCFKAVVVGVEKALGDKAAAIAFIAAGRQRGKQLAEELGLVNQGSNLPLTEIQSKLSYALGKDGTRLCVVERIEQVEDNFKVYTRETVCSQDELEGSTRQCTYTLGAIQGFLEALTNKRLRGTQTGSVLRGADYDILEYHPL